MLLVQRLYDVTISRNFRVDMIHTRFVVEDVPLERFSELPQSHSIL
jgi:hypothetical protein